MTITVLCMRRFNVKRNGVASIVRLVKALELPAVPGRDQLVDPMDGTPEMVAWTTRLCARGTTPPALAPPRTETAMKTEHEAGLKGALMAGWVALPVDPPGPA